MEKSINNTTHSFSVALASQIGLNETILLGHLYHWCIGNSDNKDMIKDGYIWVYLSRKKMCSVYPYFTENIIKYTINKLSEKEYIKIANYNKLAIDKTNWYALTDKAYNLYGTSISELTNVGEKRISIGEKCTSNSENNQAIQYIEINYNNKDNKEDTNVSKKDGIDYAYIKEQWEAICPMLASIRDLNPKRKKAIANTLKNNNANVDDMIKCFKIIASSEFCKGDNKQAWKATFDWIINDTKSCFNRLLEGEFSKNMYEHKLYESIMKGSDNSNDNVNKKILINGVEYK